MDIEAQISEQVDSAIIPTLEQYIRIPSLSPMYDPDWESNGHMEAAQQILINYVISLNLRGFSHEIVKDPGLPWLFYGEVAASDPSKKTILMYGHMDKQPHFSGWREGTGPTTPVIIDSRLYGRGASDDGYALPTSAYIVKLMQEHNIPHGRIILLAENEEESGSQHLMHYIYKLKDKIGNPDLLICLDSGVQNYEQLWITNSLRGVLKINVKVSVLEIGQHSGDASGVVPDSFRISRLLLDRLEDPETGEVRLKELHTSIPPRIYASASGIVQSLGDKIIEEICWLPGMQPVSDDMVQIVINRTMKPTITVIGAEGLPALKDAGNLIRPYTTLRLSIRIPPGVDAQTAQEAVIREVTRDPPYGATVEAEGVGNAGWMMEAMDAHLSNVLNEASLKYFGKEAMFNGEGGSIHFIGMFAKAFPESTLLVTGLLNSDSNAHSANENLHIPYLKKLTGCLFHMLCNF